MSEKMKRDEGFYALAGYEGATCENCLYCKEVHCVPIKSKEPVKIKHLCVRDPDFGNGFEVNPKEFCDFFTPKFSQSPKNDKLEIVYHGHTVVLSNTTDGIRVEIKEPKNE